MDILKIKKKTASVKVLRDIAFNIAKHLILLKTQNMDIKEGLSSVVL